MCYCYEAELLDRPEPSHEIEKIIWSKRPEDLELSDGTRYLVTQLRAANKL
ncbi:MAG: hypothetical protein Q7S14_01250 [bacterium]|nr:hypothetical protein [bacterium]